MEGMGDPYDFFKQCLQGGPKNISMIFSWRVLSVFYNLMSEVNFVDESVQSCKSLKRMSDRCEL